MIVYGEALIKRATEVAEMPWQAVCKDVDRHIPPFSPEPKLWKIHRLIGGAAIVAYIGAGAAIAAGAVGVERAADDVSGNTVVNPLGDGLFAAELIIGASQLKREARESISIRPTRIMAPSASVLYTYESLQDIPAAEAA